MTLQVMKHGSISLSPTERLAIKTGQLNKSRRPIIAKRSLSARKVWYAIFYSGERVAIRVPVIKGKPSLERTTKT